MAEVRFEETERGPALANGLVRVEVHLNKGTFDLIDVTTGRRVLTDAAVSVWIQDGPAFATRGAGLDFSGTDDVDDRQGHGTALLLMRETDADEPGVSFTLTVYENEPFAVVRAEVQNLAKSPIRVRSFQVLEGGRLDMGSEGSALRFYKHGWQSWSPALVLDCGGEDIVVAPPTVGPGTQPQPAPGRFASDMMTAVVEPESNYGVVAGFISNADQFSSLWLDRDAGTLTAQAYADGVEVEPRASLAAERLYIEATADPQAAMQRYGTAMGREMEALAYDRVTSGWCSWYYYFQGISEAEIVANLEELAANRDAMPIEYVQIDDGYQAEIGDWLTIDAEKFPRGMKWIADRIHGKGYKAGLWVAPFLAGARSKLFQEHPEWFVKFSTGAPAIGTMNWGQMCFALDLTHPEVLGWLQDLFRTICDEWGYDYVKIDFIFAGAVDGVRHDPNVTRAQAYRRGLEVIRDAVGNRFVLACGNPVGPSVGLVEGARIGPDVAPYWNPVRRQAPRTLLSDPAAINSIRNTLTRFWTHEALWMNDPDCLLVRETDGALTEDEVRSLTTAIGLSGGMVLSSDNLPKVSAERRDLISLLLPVYGRPAVPLDLFQTPEVPQLFSLDCGTHRALGAFNWEDEPRDVEACLPDGRWHVWEFWERRYLGALEGTVTLPVPAHGCRLLRLTPDLGHPQVVGSTLHITMGAMEIPNEQWDGERITLRVRPVAKDRGDIYIWRPEAMQIIEAEGLTEESSLTL